MTKEELKEVRRKSGLTRDKFSRKLGVNPSTLHKWELPIEDSGNPIPEWGSNLIKLTFPEFID